MKGKVKIGLIGDFDSSAHTHTATNEAIAHTARCLSVDADVSWLGTETLAGPDFPDTLRRFDGLWCAPGSPYKSLEGALNAVRFAREEGIPFVGT